MIRPLRSEADYNEALQLVEHFFQHEPTPGTPVHVRPPSACPCGLPKRHWPIDPPDPIEAIRCRMETAGHPRADLGRLLGSRQRASNVLNRRRRLTMGMATKLHRE